MQLSDLNLKKVRKLPVGGAVKDTASSKSTDLFQFRVANRSSYTIGTNRPGVITALFQKVGKAFKPIAKTQKPGMQVSLAPGKYFVLVKGKGAAVSYRLTLSPLPVSSPSPQSASPVAAPASISSSVSTSTVLAASTPALTAELTSNPAPNPDPSFLALDPTPALEPLPTPVLSPAPDLPNPAPDSTDFLPPLSSSRFPDYVPKDITRETQDSSGNTYKFGREDGKAVISKYNSQGTKVWQRGLGFTGTVRDIEFDDQGNYYVAATEILSNQWFLPVGRLPYDTNGYIFKYAANGDQLWQQKIHTFAETRLGKYTPLLDDVLSIVLDGKGGLYATGFQGVLPGGFSGYQGASAIDGNLLFSKFSTADGAELPNYFVPDYRNSRYCGDPPNIAYSPVGRELFYDRTTAKLTVVWQSYAEFSWQADREKSFNDSRVVAAHLTPDMKGVAYNGLSGFYAVYTNGVEKLLPGGDGVISDYKGPLSS